MNDTEYFNEVADSKDWSTHTKYNYSVSLKQYTKFCGLSFIDLLDEAYKDEEAKTPHYRLRLRTRLNNWIRSMKEEGWSKNTISSRKNAIVLLYKYAGIHIPELEKISGKSFTNNPATQLQYDDIITRQEIQKALELCNPTMRAIILTSATTGSAKKEVMSMTIRHFIEGTKDYHHLDLPTDLTVEEQYDFLKKVLKHLEPIQIDMVITFKMIRAKVQKNYYTFCTPECTETIIKMLKQRIIKRDFTNHNNHKTTAKYIGFDDKLFKMNGKYLSENLQWINKTLDLGKAGRYNKMNIHMLRRYFATTLSNPINGDLDTVMPSEYIDAFEGRSKNSMISIYAKKNPSELKKIYMKYMYRLVIDVEKDKYKELSRENKELKLRAEKVDLIEDEIKNMKETYDTILENNKKKWLSI